MNTYKQINYDSNILKPNLLIKLNYYPEPWRSNNYIRFDGYTL